MDTKRIEALRAEMQGKYRMESVSVGTLSCLLDALLAPAASEPAQEPEPCVFGQESDCSCSKHRCPKCSGPGSSRTLPCVDCAQEPERCDDAPARGEAEEPVREAEPIPRSVDSATAAAFLRSVAQTELFGADADDARAAADLIDDLRAQLADTTDQFRRFLVAVFGEVVRARADAAIVADAEYSEHHVLRMVTDLCSAHGDLRARLAQAQSWEQTLRACLRGEQGYQQEDEDGNVVYEVNVAELREKLDAVTRGEEVYQTAYNQIYDELQEDQEKLAAAERDWWDLYAEKLTVMDDAFREARRDRERAEAAERSLAEANAYAEHEARTRRAIEKERDDAVSECGAAVVRAEAAEREIAAWERCAGIVVMAADGCDPDDRTPDALPRLVAGRITREEKRAEAAERERDDLVLQINEACAATECCSTLAEMRDTVIEGSHRLVKLERERDEARAELAENGTTLCCAYCGWIVTGITDPEQRRDAVVEHFLDCPKAPYAKMAFALQMGAICDEHIGVHQPACPICAARDRTRELTESLIQAANWQKRAEAAERRVEELTAELLNLRHTLDAALWRADRCERENLTLRVAVYQAHTATSEISRAIEAAGCSPALTAAINAVTRQRDALAAALALHREGDDRG